MLPMKSSANRSVASPLALLQKRGVTTIARLLVKNVRENIMNNFLTRVFSGCLNVFMLPMTSSANRSAASPPAPLQKRGVTTIARLLVKNVLENSMNNFFALGF